MQVIVSVCHMSRNKVYCVAHSFFIITKGIERKCVHLENVDRIERIKFMPISISNKSLYLFDSPQTRIETRLICLTNDGKLSMVDCTLGNNQEPYTIFAPK